MLTELIGRIGELINKTEEKLYKTIKRYNTIYNNTCKQVLNFKTPNEIIEQYNKMVVNI